MSYYAEEYECTLMIESDKAELFKELAGVSGHSTTIEEVMAGIGFESYGESDGCYSFYWSRGNYGDHVATELGMLAPAFNVGGYVAFIGEDQCIWRLLVTEDGLIEQDGEVVYSSLRV